MLSKVLSLGIKTKFVIGYLFMTAALAVPFVIIWNAADEAVVKYETVVKAEQAQVRFAEAAGLKEDFVAAKNTAVTVTAVIFMLAIIVSYIFLNAVLIRPIKQLDNFAEHLSRAYLWNS